MVETRLRWFEHVERIKRVDQMEGGEVRSLEVGVDLEKLYGKLL